MTSISSLATVFKNIQNVDKINERLYRFHEPNLSGPNLFIDLPTIIHRSCDPHMGGAFILNRVFGGQSIAQGYVIGRKMFPDGYITKLEVTFIAPGQTNLPIDYCVEDFASNNGVICLLAKQNDKVIFKCFLTVVSSISSVLQTFPSDERCPPDVGPPDSYFSIETLVNMGPQDSEARKNFQKVSKRLLFDIRPVDPSLFAGFSGEVAPIVCWARLTPSLQDIPIQEPLFVVLLLSDYLVFQPAKILHDAFNRIDDYQTGSSLNHKIWIHHYDIDPRGFFLCVNDCESMAQGHPLLTGRIFDERKRCIATFIQESFIQKGQENNKAKI